MTYPRDVVSKAVNAGADTIRDALNLNDRDSDLINLVVNAALTRLDQPDADYTETPDQVRGWWDW